MAPSATKLLTVAGTRPEILKLAPVIRELKARGGPLTTETCFSGQHREILESVLGGLDIEPDHDLRDPVGDQSLSQSLAWLLSRLDRAITACTPDGVIVQGDTNTVLASAMTAFHHHLPVFYVEAGLRTSTPYLPFPEEMNRRLASQLATLYFAPTERARDNLLAENVAESRIVLTGNPVIDTLRLYATGASPTAEAILARCRPGTRRILVTLHRRENVEAVAHVTRAVQRVLLEHADVEVLWLLHLNGTRALVQAELKDHPAVHLIEPQDYRAFVHLMKASHFIMSDSGGVQEEAPALGRPVLVLRDETERPEAVEAGSARIVGCDPRRIAHACSELLTDEAAYAAMAVERFPFGDGHASERIVDAIEGYFARDRRLSTDRVGLSSSR